MTLAIARAMMIGGSLLAGGYGVFGLMHITNLDAALPRERLIRGLITGVAAVGVVVVGWLLERGLPRS